MKTDKLLVEELKNLEETLFRNNIRKSPAELSKIISDEFLEIGSSGNVYKKNRLLKTCKLKIILKYLYLILKLEN